MTDSSIRHPVVIIGAGPAGLTAAYELSRHNVRSLVVEKDNDVGGLAKTVTYKGYHFDIGGHRFFTKVVPVEEMWKEILGEDLLERKRLSRIYYNKKFFYYPLRPVNALVGLGLGNSLLILGSYIKARLSTQNATDTFEQWVSHHFGERLYRIFFKTYTEKVWGIPCSEIRAEWASQRIRGLSLLTVIKNSFLTQNNKEALIKTLIDSFHYPRFGPGMMWKKVAQAVQDSGSEVWLSAAVESLHWKEGKLEAIEIKRNGKSEVVQGQHYISTMAIQDLIRKLRPSPPLEILEASGGLHYRDFLTVVLIVNKPDLFPDNWIYIHDPDVKVGRIQNFKNWSSSMVPDPQKTCIGLEYFCFEGEDLWNSSDRELIELGTKEMAKLGLVSAQDVEDGTVVRVSKAYPVYDSTYADSLLTIRSFLDRITNLQLIGRNGMHKYNNQDHSMLTGMLAARNFLGARYDLWMVNVEQNYQEELTVADEKLQQDLRLLRQTQPAYPARATAPIVESLLLKTFARLDKVAFAFAVGSVMGTVTFLMTVLLILKGGEEIGPNLSLLGQYFIGYTVTLRGGFLGFAYTFLWGFLFGWLFAYLRNLSIGVFFYFIKQKAEANSFKNMLDFI